MKILQVISVFSPLFGGPVTVARSISKELAKRHEVVVYTTTALDLKHDFKPKEEEVDGYKIRYFSRAFKPLSYSYLFGQLNISWDMMEAIKHDIREFDIIHLHSWRQFPDIIVHHYASKYNVPYIIQAHGSIPRIGKKFRKLLYDFTFGYRVLDKASKVIALNKVEAEQYRSMGVPKEKIVIIPNGIDLSEYAELPPKGSFKKKFGIPEDRKIILYLGRIHKIKGIDFLIKAYAYLINEMKCRDAILVIAGPDDGYLSEIKSLVQALDISNSILFVGPLYGEDKLAAYIDSEIYVLPSRYETFPMTLLEAYACGKPVVASKVGGLRDLVSNGETGLLFEPGNVKQLARNIFNLLNGNDVAKEMGLKGKNFVRGNFTIEKVVERLEKLYEEVVKG
jgi:glycosyltransferase involved in cell wall biosynthesis